MQGLSLYEELCPICVGRPGCQAQSDLDTAELKSYHNPKIRRRVGIINVMRDNLLLF